MTRTTKKTGSKRSSRARSDEATSSLSLFHASTRAWFEKALGDPTDVQERAFPLIARGDSVLVSAPTGSGKTLAAFLASIDRVMHTASGDRHRDVSVIYVSPLKALATDIEKNLSVPVAGILGEARATGEDVREPRIVVRTGDTPAKERAQFLRRGGDLLITTPESLYLMLSSEARRSLVNVKTIIVDEIHAIAGTKRGTHLLLSLERLEAARESKEPLQRIGLSATQRPLELVARALGGFSSKGEARPVAVVEAAMKRTLDLQIEYAFDPSVPLPPEERGLAKEGVERLVELIRAHKSTMVFVNSRRLGERLAGAINKVAGEEIALAHHGSVAHEKRREIEGRLKAGDLPAIVATSSLELGIDMGAVDLVAQIEAPPSVASGVQRVGRAGHSVGEISKGVVLPRFQSDLLASAATVRAMEEGRVERTSVPMSPLDVLAQQIVAIVATEPMKVSDLHALVSRAMPYADLSREALYGVLDMLSGLYPSDEFAGLRPRISWDRETGMLTPRAGARAVAIQSGGTIADRGLYGVYLAGEGGKATRVGELDEEMVFETRIGDVFLLGASGWRVEEITPDRVLVSPAPGEPGRMPFWRGDRAGRPAELGARIGELARKLADASDADARNALQRAHHLDATAAKKLVEYLDDQRQSTGEVPSDRTVVIERFKDEVGDVRICILSPFGGRVHAAWAMAVMAAARDRRALEMDVIPSDDGVVFRVPDVDSAPDDSFFLIASADAERLVTSGLDSTALFAGRFRENAARALLLPRGRPGKRSPLWAQRRKASELLRVASRFDSFPIVLETYRECLRDVLDVPAFVDLMKRIEDRSVRVLSVTSMRPSPFARSLLFSYVGSFVYEGDAPLAERRAQALRVDPARLRELLGDSSLRDVLDRDAIAAVESGLQRLGDRRVHHADGMHDMLLSIGDLTEEEIVLRTDAPEPRAILTELAHKKRVVSAAIGGEMRWFAAEDAGRMRDAVGASVPDGVPEAFLAHARDALGDVVSRFARTHGPFDRDAIATRFGLSVASLAPVLDRFVHDGRLVLGAFRPGAEGEEYCDAEVLRKIKRRSLAKLRREIEPVPEHVLAAFAVVHHRLIHPARGEAALLSALEELEGFPIPASVLLGDVLPARVRSFSPFDLDHLTARGEIFWRGIEPVGAHDARVALFFASSYPLLAPPPSDPKSDLERAIMTVLETRGAIFFRDIELAVGGFGPDTERALWDLVWAGRVTNDTLAPLRSRLASKEKSRQRPGRRELRPPRTTRLEGRWSLLPTELATPTDRAAALAETLLARHGVVTREAVMAEAPPGGYASVYPIFRAMEEAGKIRRGYFVHGVAAMQFAIPGAEDRLRSLRSETSEKESAVMLASTDPANVYGASVPWPSRDDAADLRFERSAGTWVILRGGRLLAFVGRGKRALRTVGTLAGDDARSVAEVLVRRAEASGPILVERIDGDSARSSALADALVAVGFRPSGTGGLLYVTSLRSGSTPDMSDDLSGDE